MPNDPITPHSAPIAAYMSVHAATNLAYVQHYAQQPTAVAATFKSLNSQNFTLEYTLPNGDKSQCVIPFPNPLTRRDEIRPVLEAMAKEAETALGLPSSLAGPPPLSAIVKAVYAQATDMYTPEEPPVPLDLYYSPDSFWQTMVTAGVGATFLLHFATDIYLQKNFPPFFLELRDRLGPSTIKYIWHALIGMHTVESVGVLITCIRRKWYSPLNIAKWTASTFLFGFPSVAKLAQHGKEVRHGLKYE